jgi:hypothetical protein
MPDSDSRLITVYSTNSQSELGIIKSLLESADIKVAADRAEEAKDLIKKRNGRFT